MAKTFKVKMRLSIGLANAEQRDTVEFECDEIKGKTPDEIEEFIHEAWKEWAWQYIDGGPEMVE